ncbi:hypothetical protein [Nannocystis radixulma]|uniref:Uncharacterized protein n=1 Tax=Nannocystis radixulma TaxID=2995305 RepID=A0ABT5B1R9_9BACT|nr:hypothetical protein [Nannocystis radixulma]MDC0667011.1 hypothetical protein [Nannocystis radixulma]
MHEDPRIIPGRGIEPFEVGRSGESQIALLTGEQAVEARGTMRVVKTRDVTLFIEDEVVTQVGIHEEHTGRTSDGLRLGMTLGEVAGELMLDPYNEVLLLAGVAGLCFSTDDDAELGRAADEAREEGAPVVLSRADRIMWIGVHLPEIDSPEAVTVRLK